METTFEYKTYLHVESSYRTYEEWKRPCVAWRSAIDVSSYRTYEEWKPGLPSSSICQP